MSPVRELTSAEEPKYWPSAAVFKLPSTPVGSPWAPHHGLCNPCPMNHRVAAAHPEANHTQPAAKPPSIRWAHPCFFTAANALLHTDESKTRGFHQRRLWKQGMIENLPPLAIWHTNLIADITYTYMQKGVSCHTWICVDLVMNHVASCSSTMMDHWDNN